MEESWKTKSTASDFYFLKGLVAKILQLLGISVDSFESLSGTKFEMGLQGKIKGEVVLQTAIVHKKILSRFDIKQPVFFADLNWDVLSTIAANNKPAFSPIPKFPAVQRDLAMIVPSHLAYEEVEKAV